MQLTLSETTENMLVDIVDVFDVSVPLEKSDRVTSRVPVASTVQLYQNYPNPFNPSTSITFNIPEAGDVHLSIHDNLGRRVATALSRHLDAGVHTVDFHAGHLSSGVYFYRLTANGETHTRRMTLLR
jgi:hypothetical protein